MKRESGDQNGYLAPSVPAKLCGHTRLQRTHPEQVRATCIPSRHEGEATAIGRQGKRPAGLRFAEPRSAGTCVPSGSTIEER